MNLVSCVIPHAKLNSKCIKDLKVRAKAIKLSEENMCIDLHNLGLKMVSYI